jgi:rhodanese-related sulfurtransferase
MLQRLFTVVLLAIAIAAAGPAWSYDAALAESYAKLFAPVQGAAAGKALHLIKPDAFLNKIKAREPLVVIDVRTPAETGVYSVTLPGTLTIPIAELFTEANLARLPTDKTVVVLCLSGTRATAAGTALRHIGFDNVYILKGGFKALTGYMGPKEANSPAAATPARKPAEMKGSATPQAETGTAAQPSAIPVQPQPAYGAPGFGYYPLQPHYQPGYMPQYPAR